MKYLPVGKIRNIRSKIKIRKLTAFLALTLITGVILLAVFHKKVEAFVAYTITQKISSNNAALTNISVRLSTLTKTPIPTQKFTPALTLTPTLKPTSYPTPTTNIIKIQTPTLTKTAEQPTLTQTPPTPTQSTPTLTPQQPTPVPNNVSSYRMELLGALNNYRQKKGTTALIWNDNLANFAQSRADFFSKKGGMDNHAGFTDFINNQNGFNKLGFRSLGENSSYGYNLSATDLIEKAFGGHAPHDENQLNSKWTHVGIGVSGKATDFIFGGSKI